MFEGVADGGADFGEGGVEGAVGAEAGGFGVAAAAELFADLVDVDVAFGAEGTADAAVGHFGEECDDFDGLDGEGHVDEVFRLAGGGAGFGEVGLFEGHAGEAVGVGP